MSLILLLPLVLLLVCMKMIYTTMLRLLVKIRALLMCLRLKQAENKKAE